VYNKQDEVTVLKLTIRQIAEKANVSRGTVDKILHDRPGVSDSVRKSVRQIIDEYGYTPNKVAKALVGIQKPIVFAAIMPHIANLDFAAVKSGMDEAMESLVDWGVKTDYYFTENANSKEVCALLDYLLLQKIDGVAIRTFQDEDICRKLRVFIEKGIPVLTFDSDIKDIDRFCFVGEDLPKGGRIGASLISKLLNGSGEVVVFTGYFNVHSNQLRVDAFCSTMKEKHPGIKVVEVVETLDQQPIAYKRALEILEKYPNLKGIVNVAGCTKAIATALIDAKKDHIIRMISFTVAPDVVELINRGVIDFTIGISTHKKGILAINTLFNYVFHHENPPSDYLMVPLYIGIEETLDVFED
jgi:LacI family transcriptional regulator